MLYLGLSESPGISTVGGSDVVTISEFWIQGQTEYEHLEDRQTLSNRVDVFDLNMPLL